jgi:NAD(P)-dependent dehydrogenase (short-subunit alcohol dehydrogenase family)
VAALAFANCGASVILHGRNVAKLEAVYDEITARGFAEPAIMPLDFLKTTQSELDAFAQSIHAMFGHLDILFHGASHFVTCMPLASQNLDVWEQHIRVNLTVPAAITKACMPLLKRAPNASVIFLTESHAFEPKAFWGAFSASKGALENLTAIWADELDVQSAVRVNLCLPGPVASPMRSKSHPGETSSQLPTMQSLASYFLYLAGADSAPLSGALLDCTKPASDIP